MAENSYSLRYLPLFYKDLEIRYNKLRKNK